jgi:hypothetical protein
MGWPTHQPALMILDDRHGHRLELHLRGYQFPDLTDVESDANWLQVGLEIETPEGTWSATEPCLMTWEAAELARWIANVANGLPQGPFQDFVEPCLSFGHEVEPGGSTIRVRLSHEFSPPWVDYHEGIRLTFPGVPRDLQAAADALAEEVRACPPRAGAELKPPIVPQTLLPRFIIDWKVTLPGRSEEEATGAFRSYLAWIDLDRDVEVRRVTPVTGKHDRWEIRAISALPVPGSEAADAMLALLFRLPNPHASPEMRRPLHFPDGRFLGLGTLDPRDSDDSGEAEGFDPGQIRGWFALSNYEDDRRFWWTELARRS